MQSLLQKKRTRSLIVTLVTLALLLTSVIGATWASPDEGSRAYAAKKATYPSPYPWSKTSAATTGDYIADVYSGITKGEHVIRDVYIDRLADILQAKGDYYIVLASPSKSSSQKILSTINKEAKANGITEVYHFNPILDDYQLDITSTGEVASWGSTVPTASGLNFVNWEALDESPGHLDHSLGSIWTYIKGLLPASANANAIRSYKAGDTLLFHFHKTNHTDYPSQASVGAVYTFKTSQVQSANLVTEATKIDAVFATAPNDERSDFDYFNRAYTSAVAYAGSQTSTSTAINAKRKELEEGYGNAAARWGIPDSGADKGKGFNLVSVTWNELFNILNSPGEHAIFFAQLGCPNVRAIFPSVVTEAKKYNRTIYVVSGGVDGNIRWDDGPDIDKAIGYDSGNYWWNIRVSQTGGGHYADGLQASYVYGAITKDYFGPNFLTENWTKKSQTIPYYIDGAVGDESKLTSNPFTYPTPVSTSPSAVYGDDPDAEAPFNAPRLQYPTIVSYNKDATYPVNNDTHWISIDNGGPGINKEYMLQLSDVLLATDGDDTNDNLISTTGKDFTLEGVNGLARVFNPATLKAKRDAAAAAEKEKSDGGTKTPAVTKDFAQTGTPTITGKAQLGSTLTAQTGTWSDSPSFAYAWYRSGKAIAGATKKTYKPVKADVGKTLEVRVTASKTGFKSVTKTSAATAKVKGVFAGAKVTVTGKAKVSKTLKAKVTGVSSLAPKIKYQWYAGSKAIKGATKATLKLKKAQKGKKIKVKVTLTKANYIKKAVTSKATAKVK